MKTLQEEEESLEETREGSSMQGTQHTQEKQVREEISRQTPQTTNPKTCQSQGEDITGSKLEQGLEEQASHKKEASFLSHRHHPLPSRLSFHPASVCPLSSASARQR